MGTETVDRLRGRGIARLPSGLHAQVDYRLTVTRDLLVSRPGDQLLPGLLDVRGEVGLPMVRLDPLADLDEPFELELEDGRKLKLMFAGGPPGGVRLADIGDLKDAYE